METTNIAVEELNITNYNFTDLPEDDMDNHHGNLDKLLWMYWSPFTFCIGMVGNIFVILVLMCSGTSKTRHTTTAIYLTIMAMADMAFLVVGIIPEWLEACQFFIVNEVHPVTCKLEKFLFYTFGDVAIWIMCAFTFDRFIAVCFPFKKQHVCTPKYAKITAVVIMVVSCGKNMHVFWTRGPVFDSSDAILETNCGRPEPFSYFERYIRPWIAFAFVNLIPFIVVITCNIFIIKTLIKAQRRMASVSTNDSGFMQTIFMCLSASFAFLLCITPSIIVYIGKPYWTSEGNPNYTYNIAKAITNQLAYVNHSINFFLYCITGRKFREQFVTLFRGQHRKYSKAVNPALKFCGDKAIHVINNNSKSVSNSGIMTDITVAVDKPKNGHTSEDTLEGL